MPRKSRDERLLDTYMTVRAAAAFLGVTPGAIKDRIHRKTLPAVVISRRQDGSPRMYLVQREAVLGPKHRPGRPSKAKGRRFVPEHETGASLDGTDFLEAALAELPGEAAGGGDSDARDTKRYLGSRRGASDEEPGEG